MSFNSLAQELLVVEDTTLSPQKTMELIPLTIVDEGAHVHEPLEVHDHDHNHSELQVLDEPTTELELVVEELPGAPSGLPDPEEEILEVEEEKPEEKLDENEAKKIKKNEKWDWSKSGAEGFVPWIKERLDGVPKHSGMDTAGLERAIAYLERLDAEISKAMRLDIDGDLDANKIETVRSQIDDGLDRLHDRLDKIKKTKKTKRKKSAGYDSSLVKEAQKISGVHGTIVTVPLLISAIARICVNGTVSAGKNLDDLFFKLAKKYDLNDTQKSEVAWLLMDMGYPLRGDRGFFPDEEVDVTSTENFDWMANYPS